MSSDVIIEASVKDVESDFSPNAFMIANVDPDADPASGHAKSPPLLSEATQLRSNDSNESALTQISSQASKMQIQI